MLTSFNRPKGLCIGVPASLFSLSCVRAAQVSHEMAVIVWLVSPAHVADHLDDVEAAGLDVRAFHHDVTQTHHVHAHRPHFRLALDDGDEGETHRVRAAVFGHLKPALPAVSQLAVVDEHPAPPRTIAAAACIIVRAACIEPPGPRKITLTV